MSQYRNKTQLMFRILVPIALALLLFISGCAAHSLREAQDTFAEGVQLEMKQNELVYYTEVPCEQADFLLRHSIGSAEQHYNKAAMIIDDILKNDKKSLKQNDLLGTTYVLKALCTWKLNQDGKRIGELEAVIKEAKKHTLSDQQKVILEILPALNASDRKFYQIDEFVESGNDMTKASFTKIMKPIFYDEDSIRSQLNATIAKNPQTQLKLYLQEAELNLYNHYHYAYDPLIGYLEYLELSTKSEIEKEKFEKQLANLKKKDAQIKIDYKEAWDSYRTTMHYLKDKAAAEKRLKFRRDRLIGTCDECKEFLEVEILTPEK